MASFYWERHPDGPFATLIAMATNYLDPENYDLDALKRLAKREDVGETVGTSVDGTSHPVRA